MKSFRYPQRFIIHHLDKKIYIISTTILFNSLIKYLALDFFFLNKV